jgi:hypothetical protein
MATPAEVAVLMRAWTSVAVCCLGLPCSRPFDDERLKRCAFAFGFFLQLLQRGTLALDALTVGRRPACCHRVDGALNDLSLPQRHGGVLDTYPLQLDGPRNWRGRSVLTMMSKSPASSTASR